MVEVETTSLATCQHPLGEGWVLYDVFGPAEMGLPGISQRGAVSGGPHPPGVTDLVERLEGFRIGRESPIAGDDLLDRADVAPSTRRIYEIVAGIPRGQTMTYSDVAITAGRSGASRAVDAVMARNPFAPVIPCHRVVGSDGTLRGYRGGLEMKSALLAMEHAVV